MFQLVELGFNAEDAESNWSVHSEAAAGITLAKVRVTDRSVHEAPSFKPSTIEIKVGEETGFLSPYRTGSEQRPGAISCHCNPSKESFLRATPDSHYSWQVPIGSH